MVVVGVVLVEVEVVVIAVLIVVGVVRRSSVKGPTEPLIFFVKRAEFVTLPNLLCVACSSA